VASLDCWCAPSRKTECWTTRCHVASVSGLKVDVDSLKMLLAWVQYQFHQLFHSRITLSNLTLIDSRWPVILETSGNPAYFTLFLHRGQDTDRAITLRRLWLGLHGKLWTGHGRKVDDMMPGPTHIVYHMFNGWMVFRTIHPVLERNKQWRAKHQQHVSSSTLCHGPGQRIHSLPDKNVMQYSRNS